MKRVILAAFVCSTVLGIGVYRYLPSKSPEAYPEIEQNRQLITAWLEDQKSGGDGVRFWGPDILGDDTEALKLYSVRNYEFLRCDPVGATVRVDSSNALGVQITKTWRVETSAYWPDANPYRDPNHIVHVNEAD
jgi:hypothetical protein